MHLSNATPSHRKAQALFSTEGKHESSVWPTQTLSADKKPADVDCLSATRLARKETHALVPSLMALAASNVVAKLESKGL